MDLSILANINGEPIAEIKKLEKFVIRGSRLAVYRLYREIN